MVYLKRLAKMLYFWRWPARERCHKNFLIPCQYTDEPMDNHP